MLSAMHMHAKAISVLPRCVADTSVHAYVCAQRCAQRHSIALVPLLLQVEQLGVSSVQAYQLGMRANLHDCLPLVFPALCRVLTPSSTTAIWSALRTAISYLIACQYQ